MTSALWFGDWLGLCPARLAAVLRPLTTNSRRAYLPAAFVTAVRRERLRGARQSASFAHWRVRALRGWFFERRSRGAFRDGSGDPISRGRRHGEAERQRTRGAKPGGRTRGSEGRRLGATGMFDGLTGRLGDIFDKLRRRGSLSEEEVVGRAARGAHRAAGSRRCPARGQGFRRPGSRACGRTRGPALR